MDCVVWMLDSGAERWLAISLGSLRLCAPTYWDKNLKLIIDFGIRGEFADWLRRLETQGVLLWQCSYPSGMEVVGGDPRNGPGVMRRRVNVTDLVRTATEGCQRSIKSFLVCDCDTVFLASPDDFPYPPDVDHVSVMKEWDSNGSQDFSMSLCRSSTFSQGAPSGELLGFLSEQLRIPTCRPAQPPHV